MSFAYILIVQLSTGKYVGVRQISKACLTKCFFFWRLILLAIIGFHVPLSHSKMKKIAYPFEVLAVRQPFV